MDADIAVRALLAGLGGWRLASLLVVEDGPGAIFARLRARAGLAWPATPEPIEGFWAGVLSCVWCCSVWTVTALYALSYLHPMIAALPAAWGAAIVAERLSRG